MRWIRNWQREEAMAEKGKRYLIAGTAAVLVLSLAAAVFAYWSVPGNTINYLTMSSYQTKIAEEYEIPEYVNPSDEITKVVHVENTGTVDTLVRVSVEKVFGTRQPDGSFLRDETLDPDMIEIRYHDDWWEQKEDGYFYYKEILRAGTGTKEPLLDSYRLSEKADNRYRKKDAEIIISMESVQAEGDGVKLWGMTWEELGIARPPQGESRDTSVHYRGRENGFDITKKQTDLFASFKNLLPGCARTQKITIANDSGTQTELFLRAEAAEQKTMNSQQAVLVQKLLNQYAKIRITGEKGVLYEGPVSGNPSGNETSMKYNISLGTYAPWEKKELLVTLSVDSAMDNHYQDLTGRVRWVFTAVGEDETGLPTETVLPPVTGDETQIFMWAALLLTSGGFLTGAFLIWKWNRRKRENQ